MYFNETREAYESRRYAALESAIQSLIQAVIAVAPPAPHRDPGAAVTRSVTLSGEQLETRRENVLHLTYFIINAVVRKKVFSDYPEANPSREMLNISYSRCAKLPLTETTFYLVVSHCLTHFSQVTDWSMSFIFANKITQIMGWKHVCHQCGKKFEKKRSLLEHKASAHQNISFYGKCSFYKCTACFFSLPTLMNHHREDHGFDGIWQQNVIMFQLLENQAKLSERLSTLDPILPVVSASTQNSTISRSHYPPRDFSFSSALASQGSTAADHSVPPSDAQSFAGNHSSRSHGSARNPHDPRSEVLSALLSPAIPQPSDANANDPGQDSDSHSSGELPVFPSAMNELFQEYSSNHFFGSGEL